MKLSTFELVKLSVNYLLRRLSFDRHGWTYVDGKVVDETAVTFRYTIPVEDVVVTLVNVWVRLFTAVTPFWIVLRISNGLLAITRSS